jgi:heme/copper-type cytochrome/quinol oxidase subunit 2
MKLEIIIALVPCLITAYIAWRHWQTDELKRRHDLYERRLKVYDAVMEFFENFETSDGAEFLRQLRESRFLFSKELSIYLHGIHKDWLIYLGIRRQFKDPQTKPEEPEFSRLSKEKSDIAVRLMFEGPIATEKFAKEMKLSKI